MALINRVSRLFKADINAVLDQLEEPELVLRQAIRDMEDDIAAAERRLRQLDVDRAHLAEQGVSAKRAVADATEQLDLCFEADNEVLARKFIRRQLESRQLQMQLEQRLELCDRLLEEGRTDLTDKKSRLDNLQQKAALFEPPAMRSEHGEVSDGMGCSVARISDDDVEVAFLREKRDRGAS